MKTEARNPNVALKFKVFRGFFLNLKRYCHLKAVDHVGVCKDHYY